jgi:hypothetical protein
MLVHPLIKNAKRVLGSARTIDRGVLKPDRGVECLDLRVSKGCLPRALGVMASMLQILEKEGFSVVVEKRDKESTSAMIYGEEIRFGVVERSRQIRPSPTQDAKTANTTSYAYNPIRLEPTGLLSIEVWNFYSGSPQKTWRDREGATLEEQLPTCVAGMLRIALWSRAERNAREREAEAKQKKVDEVTEVLDRIEEEEKRIKALKREAIAWSRAERIRNYIAAVRAEAAKNSDSSERTKLLEWTDWAEQQADRADPLKKSPASIIDEKDEVLRRLHSVRWGW